MGTSIPDRHAPEIHHLRRHVTVPAATGGHHPNGACHRGRVQRCADQSPGAEPAPAGYPDHRSPLRPGARPGRRAEGGRGLLELAANVRREDVPALGLCPYKGLNYFDESDAELFVGREALAEQLTEQVLKLATPKRTSGARFLAIVGASGSGKSSLVRAGLIPSLRWGKQTAGWQIISLTPSARPLESLAGELTQGSSVAATARLIDDLRSEPRSLHLFAKQLTKAEGAPHLLLVVDQFEELFTLCHSEVERACFIDNLLTAASEPAGPTIVILTLRADFYAACAAYPLLRQGLADHQEYIGAMNEQELRRVIEEPARRGRWELEPGLTDLVLYDVGQEPGALPLLSHALMETWGGGEATP